MKLALLCDNHFGVKNSSDVFLSYQESFFRDIFFPYCVQNGITKILHAGDYFDNRKFISVKTLKRSREFFLDRLEEFDMTMDIIPGNHDVFFKNTNDLCSLSEIFNSPRVNIISSPKVIRYGSLDIGFLPWITTENYAESMEFLKTAPCAFIVSHLELAGFEMMKGQPVTSHGMDAKLFSRFEKVLSGHFHTRSTQGNIYYLGTQFELTWADYDDKKFFHVIDTETRSLTPIRNPLTIFNKVIYNDSKVKDIGVFLASQNFEYLRNTFVKIVVVEKKDPFLFDQIYDKIQSIDPFDIKIIDTIQRSDEGVEVNLEELADVDKILNNYIDDLDTTLDKDKLKNIIQQLYIEAQNADFI